MYIYIKEIPGLLNADAKFLRKPAIANKYPESFEYDGKEYAGKIGSRITLSN